jgi:hypothetical protein
VCKRPFIENGSSMIGGVQYELGQKKKKKKNNERKAKNRTEQNRTGRGKRNRFLFPFFNPTPDFDTPT